MKLFYLTNLRLPTEKAHGFQIMKTAEAFGLLGVNVEMVVPRRKNYIQKTFQEFYRLKYYPSVYWLTNTFGIVEYFSKRSYFFLQRISFGMQAFFFAITKKDIVIYSRDLLLSFFLSLAGKKVVYEDHEPKKKLRSLYAFLLAHISKKVVVSEHLLTLYQQMGINSLTYIFAPNGVDIDLFTKTKSDHSIWNKHFSIPVGTSVVLYVGHFYAWKGVYTLLDAASLIDNSAVVLIGGTPEDFSKVAQYISEKKINNVYLHPFVPQYEIVPFITSADILVLPNTAKEERSLKYTTPIKLFEYMASGTPIVASNIPSITSYLRDGENALLVRPDDPEDLAKKINFLCSTPEIGKKIANTALLHSAQWSWEKRAKKILSFIGEDSSI